MKKVDAILIVMLAIFAVCTVTPSMASEQYAIVGTGSGMPILKAVAAAFNEGHPGIAITVPKSIGSGGGIRAVGDDEYLLGRVARGLNQREQKYGIEMIPLAKMPIVFFVNTSVTITGLTSEQACGIFSGAIRRWDEIGGGEGKIRVIKREDGDSSLIVLLNTLPGFKDIALTPRSKTAYTDQENVAECIRQPNSIAFGSWADVKNERNVRVLELDGISPSDAKYPYISLLSIIYKKENYNGAVKSFIEFISSGAAKNAIIAAGGKAVE